MTDGWKDRQPKSSTAPLFQTGRNGGQPKPSIAPFFQNRAIKNRVFVCLI